MVARGNPEFSHVSFSHQADEIDLFGGRVVAIDLMERERARAGVQCVARPVLLARMERAEALANFAGLHLPLHGQHGAFGMIAKPFGECDLFLGGGARVLETGRAERMHEAPCEFIDDARALVLAHRRHDAQGRPAERGQPEKARPQGGALLGAERLGIDIPEDEGARDRPFARLRRTLEDERVGRIEPQCARKFSHRTTCSFGASFSASYHAAAASAGKQRRARRGAAIERRMHEQVAIAVDPATLAGLAGRQTRKEVLARRP